MVIKTKEEHLKKQTLLKQKKVALRVVRRKKHVLLKVKQRQGAELKECLYETAIPAGEDEKKSSSLYAEERTEKTAKEAVQQGMHFAWMKRKKKQKIESRTLAGRMVDGKLPENPVQQEAEKRRWIRRRQVQSIKNKEKRASIGEEISERIGQTAGGTGELDTILFDKCFHKNHGRYNRKRFTALKRRRRGWLPLGGGAFVLLFVVVIMFAGAIALYGSEDEEFSPDMDIVEVAESQIGNIGGMKFWKWYGFTEPVDWCACFVSWCGEQCGYIDAEKMPKFSYCQDGVN